jgi:pimeloyl-ACP methyl ester carboxylesterase
MNFLLILVLLVLAVAAFLGVFSLRTARRVEAVLPPQGQFIEVPGARLHVLDKGRGPTVLLIHGLAGQMGHFTYGVVDQLARDFRVIAVDRPGSGYSVRFPGAGANLNAQADVMAALISTMKLDKVLVVGHSLGGAVALALAQRHPDLVCGLALLAPLTHTPKKVSPAFKGLNFKRPWSQQLMAWTLALPMTISKSQEILAMAFGPEAVPADYAVRGGGLLSARPSQFIAACQDLAAVAEDLPGMVAAYAQMRVPVSVLYGRGDRLLNPGEQGQALVNALPGVQMTLVEGGHMLPVTLPELSADFIRATHKRVHNG